MTKISYLYGNNPLVQKKEKPGNGGKFLLFITALIILSNIES